MVDINKMRIFVRAVRAYDSNDKSSNMNLWQKMMNLSWSQTGELIFCLSRNGDDGFFEQVDLRFFGGK